MQLGEFKKNFFGKYESTINIIFLLFLAVTLFPPFQWGGEYIRTEENRKLFEGVLPVKGCDFFLARGMKFVELDSNTAYFKKEKEREKEIFSKLSEEQQNELTELRKYIVKKSTRLQVRRELRSGTLMLEYALILLVPVSIRVVYEMRKSKRKKIV